MKRFAEITIFAWLSASFGAALADRYWAWAIVFGLFIAGLIWVYVEGDR